MIRCKPLLGTYVEIAIDSHDADGQYVIDQAFAAIQVVQDLMSFHNPNSELSRINARAHIETIEVHDWTFEVLSISKELYEYTDGVFDCGVGKKLVESSVLPRQPYRLAEAKSSINDLVLCKPNYVFSNAPLTLDLGGIAKGFAVDKAVETLQQYGIQSGCVNAGGDLRVFGSHTQDIHIRNPANPIELIALGSLEDGAIASSGLYYCDRSKPDNGHIVDPKTGEQIQFTQSYSVVAPECVYADALTKLIAITQNPQHSCFSQYSAKAVSAIS